jgi:hypothetical protein
MIHEYTVDRITERASKIWGVDLDKLREPVGRCDVRNDAAVQLHRVRWACIVAALEAGVPRKACQVAFGASESTVARARQEASKRDVARLSGMSEADSR